MAKSTSELSEDDASAGENDKSVTHRARVPIVLLGILVVALGPPAGARRGAPSLAPSAAAGLTDPEEDCDQYVPQGIGVAGTTDDGRTVRLDVTLLLDGVSNRRANEVMTEAARSYAPLGIELDVVARKRLRIPGDPPRPEGRTPSAHMDDLFAAMKDATGGTRPDGSDVVHLLTGKDVYFVDQGEPAYGLAGVAECIGGVRYDNRAFAFSEATGQYQQGPRDLSGLIAAHEIGHLMGAHHHYGNCGEGEPLMQENETPCTLMFPAMIFWNAGNFGTLESAVVRGYAVDFAAP